MSSNILKVRPIAVTTFTWLVLYRKFWFAPETFWTLAGPIKRNCFSRDSSFWVFALLILASTAKHHALKCRREDMKEEYSSCKIFLSEVIRNFFQHCSSDIMKYNYKSALADYAILYTETFKSSRIVRNPNVAEVTL